MAFLDHILVCFEVIAEILRNQGRKFFEVFEALCTKALINHCSTFKNHLETNGLAKRVALFVKYNLRKYRLFHGNHYD
uniref:Uncharacterized protein n=2 Tax=Physcomitrium patens TaxID=3218 RepID=A0A2K1JP32_PHYPA|nr:hypothetical protein PHYPA_015689 [Physcomitrium patens]